MTRTVTAVAALAGAAALALTAVAPASAAPNSRGATEIVPEPVLLTLDLAVERPFTDRDRDGAPEFGIVGNPRSGVIKHVGGLSLDTLAGERLTVRNFWIDTRTGAISAETSLSGTSLGRVAVFQLDGLDIELNATSATVVLGDPAGAGTKVATAGVDFWNF